MAVNPCYVRSTDGNNTDTGATWALADATLVGAMADIVAGSRVWVSQVHAESTAGAVTITMPGTVTSPNQVVCGNDGAEPPTALATTATVAATGANDLTITGSGYIRGIAFTGGSGNVNNGIRLNINAGFQFYELCDFINGSTGAATNAITLNNSGSDASRIILKNCRLKLGNAAQVINFAGQFVIDGGSIISGGTSPTVAFAMFSNRTCNGVIRNFDFSNWAAGVNLFSGGAVAAAALIRFVDCKLPSSWSGSLVSASITTAGVRVEMINCAAGSTNYSVWIEDCFGKLTQETTIVRSGGASDGTTPLSWKIATFAKNSFPHETFVSPDIRFWNDTTGSSKTVTVEVVSDIGSNLKDSEIWLEVDYLGSSATPQGTSISDAAASILATAADQASSSVTWTTTGLGAPVKQALSVTFTPQMKGLFNCRVHVAKPSITVYVDPVATVT